MTITLPNELESSIQAAVRSGRFASVDDAMAEAARLLLRELGRGEQAGRRPTRAIPPPTRSWASCVTTPELMDEIVADAYRQRREETWRELDL